VAHKTKPDLIDADAPELTSAELADMRPAEEVLPSDTFAMLTKRRPGQRGPGKKPAKVQITIRIERETIEAFKAKGDGWQILVNDVLRDAASRL
jgi:uncharacterized protein (DUF4415 family)